jgi:cardiolipin synthase
VNQIMSDPRSAPDAPRPRLFRSRVRPGVIHRPVARRWREGMAPKVTRQRRPRGLPSLWLRVRRLIWSWWLWAGLTIWAVNNWSWGWWVLFAGLSLLTFLAAPIERAPMYGLDHDLTIDDPDFLETIAGLTGFGFTAGNRVTILENGDEFYPAMLSAIAGARSSVTIEAYIYWHGEVGLEFARALAERARAGVSVKILLDAVGSASIGRAILEALEAGGCELAWFNPLRWQTFSRINFRTHRKTLVVDGLVGFTGGAGIADHWAGHAQDAKHWRDTQIQLEGPCVVPLQTGFAQNWLETTGEIVTGPAFFPEIGRAGDGEVQTMLSSPSSGASAARLLYYLAIASARRSILIANPYFVPDAAAIESLAEAHHRGVRIRILVAGTPNDAFLARHNSVRLYGRLIRAGAEIYEYNRTMLHQKTMVVDGRWATIGTTNFDSRSFAFNEENNVSFFSPDLVARLAAAFEADVAESDRVALETWKRRSVGRKCIELLASVLQEQS